MAEGHLYREGARRGQLRKFENRYGKAKGKKVYGAVVGKVRREQQLKMLRQRLASNRATPSEKERLRAEIRKLEKEI